MEAMVSRAALTHAKGMARPGLSGLKGRRAQACESACIARLLFAQLYARLDSEGMIAPLVKAEMPLVPVLAAMEGVGIAFNTRILQTIKVGGALLLLFLGRRARLFSSPCVRRRSVCLSRSPAKTAFVLLYIWRGILWYSMLEDDDLMTT